MARSIAVDSPAEVADKGSWKFRLSFKMPSWQTIRKAAASASVFLWKWLKWPVIVAAVLAAAAVVIAVIYYLILPLLGALLQLIMAIVAIAAMCLWASISHLYGGADLTASYSYWLFSKESYDDWNWGAWGFEGNKVYVVGGLTGLLLAYMLTRVILRFLASRALQKKQAAESAQRAAERKEKIALDAKYAEGKAAGVAEEQAIVRRAFLHAYKPQKMTLPPIPAGRTRVFWISARMKGQSILPTQDRAIHWADITGEVPEFAIGAPAYRRVVSNERDCLAMMTVVFTLNNRPSDW